MSRPTQATIFSAEALPAAGEPVGQPPPPRRRRVWPRRVVVVALLAAALGLAWWLLRPGVPSVPQAVAVVQRGDIEDVVPALGTLQPLTFVDVGTQVSGQLKVVHVEVGQTVNAGDLLAEIDPTIYRSRVEASRAQLMNLRAQQIDRQAQLRLAEQQFQRQSNLMRARATSEDAFQSAEASLTSARAQVDAIAAQIRNVESSLEADEANLGYTRVFAPISGTVVSQTAKQGQTLNASQQAPIILRIADLSVMTVTTQVSEADVGRLRVGMDAYFSTLGRPERRWEGQLRMVLPTPEVLNNVVLYNAVFDVPNDTGELMTQMTAQAFFVSARAEDALLVPAAALRPAGEGQASVRVRRPDGGIEERRVRVGVTNRVSAQILEGLEQGETVLLGQPAGASDGGPPRRPARPPALS